MRTTRFLKSIFLVTTLVAAASFAGPSDSRTRRAEQEQWLQRMGLDDVSAKIDQNLAQQRAQVASGAQTRVGVTDVSERVLETNRIRYQILNDARAIAAEIVSSMSPQLQSDDGARQKLASLAAELAVLQPELLPEELPASVKTPAEKLAYTSELIQKKAGATTERLVTDMVNAIHGEKKVLEFLAKPDTAEATAFRAQLSELRLRTGRYVLHMSTDIEAGRSAFLGSAVTLLAARESRVAEGPKGRLEALMAQEFKKAGTHIDNFTSSTYRAVDQTGKEAAITVNHGALVGQLSNGKAAQELAALVKPGDFKSYIRQLSRRLTGYVVGPLFHGKDNVEPNLETVGGRVRDWLSNTSVGNGGVSHVGMAFHYTDPETGLVRVEVRDMHPDAVWGGARKAQLDDFALAGPQRRLLVQNVDSKKLAKAILDQDAPPVAQTDNVVQVVGNQIVPTGEVATLQMDFDAATYLKLKELAQKDPAALQKAVAERQLKTWDSFLTEKGMAFRYNTQASGVGFANCAEATGICFRRDAFVTPIKSKPRFSLFYRVLNQLGLYKTDFKLSGKAPETPSLLMASDLFSTPETLILPKMSTRERNLAEGVAYIPSKDSSLMLELRKVPRTPQDPFGVTLTRKVQERVRDFVSRNELISDAGSPLWTSGINYSSQAKSPPRVGGVAGGVVSLADEPTQTAELALTQADSIKREEAAVRGFLTEMGIKDFSDASRQALKEGLPSNEYMKLAAEANVTRYSMVNDAREAAAAMLAKAQPQMKDPAFRAKFADFVGKLMALESQSPTLEIPDEIKRMTEGKKGADLEEALLKQGEAFNKFIERSTQHDMEDQLRVLISDYANTFYGADAVRQFKDKAAIERIPDVELRTRLLAQREAYLKDMQRMSAYFGDYVRKMYVDTQTGLTRWMGRAVGLGVERYAILSKDQAFMGELRDAAARHGVELQNLIGSKLKMGGQGEARELAVRTGNWAYVKTMSVESAAIALAAKPGEKATIQAAKKQRLLGNLFNVILNAVGRGNIENGLSPIERIAIRLARLKTFDPGFSHIGAWTVYEKELIPGDASSRVSHALIFDNYPDHADDLAGKMTPGGVRVLGVEHFADRAGHSKMGVSARDSKKFVAHARAELKKLLASGLPEKAFPAFKPVYGKDGLPVPEIERTAADWKYRVNLDTLRELAAIEDPVLFERKWEEMYRKGAEDLMARGTYFNWVNAGAGEAAILDKNGVPVLDKAGKPTLKWVPGVYMEGGTYCTQFCELSSTLYTGITMEPKKGAWASILKPLAWLGVKPAKELDTAAPILPPSNMAVQPFSTPTETVHFDADGVGSDSRAMDSPPILERNAELTALLDDTPELRGDLDRMALARLNAQERATLVLRAKERIVDVGIAEGAKDSKSILGFDYEEFEKAKDAKLERKADGGGKGKGSAAGSALVECVENAVKQ